MKGRKKYTPTRYESLTFKQIRSLPDKELEELWEEHVQELKRRGDYHESTKEGFFELLNKACTSKDQ